MMTNFKIVNHREAHFFNELTNKELTREMLVIHIFKDSPCQMASTTTMTFNSCRHPTHDQLYHIFYKKFSSYTWHPLVSIPRLRVSSLHRGHTNLFFIVPILLGVSAGTMSHHLLKVLFLENEEQPILVFSTVSAHTIKQPYPFFTSLTTILFL
jgi:hypothetical protein